MFNKAELTCHLHFSAKQEMLEAKMDSVLVKLENLANNLRLK